MSNIVLTGMPGCGKSTVGVILAKTLCMGFVDSDLLIQRQHQKPLQQLISAFGVEAFLDMERDAILSIRGENTVIATGGSAVYRAEAMEHLGKNGRIFYLRLPFAQIKARLTNIATRGVALPHGQTLEQMYRERLPLYERLADEAVDCSGKSIEAIVAEIQGKMQNISRP